jgi:preprotein translocase subunit SecD
MQNNVSRTSSRTKRRTRKGSIIKFSILGAFILIVGLLSVVSFDVPWVSNGIYRFNSFASNIKLGIDLRGGVYALYEADDDDTSNLSERMDGTRARLHNLLVGRGYTESTVTREGANRLRVEVPDVDDPQAIFTIIGRPAELIIKAQDGPDVIRGDKHITGATVTTVPGGGYGVNIKMNAEGTRLFAQLTSENIGKQVQIITRVDGQEDQVTNVNVNETISGGTATISGNMPQRQDAQNLVDQIVSGSFAVRLSLLNTDIISPTLGERALSLSIIAGLIGLLLVMAYMIVVYRLMGVVASIALLLFTVLMLFLLYFVPWVQLSLPGVAGIIMSIGMAVDANVIIYERIKDEYRKGKSLNASVNQGFGRAIFAVVDSNITTVIAALSLLLIGTGSVQGFAIVLLIGILTTMFSAVLMSQLMLKWTMAITGDTPSKYGLARPEGVELVPDEDKTKPKKPTKEAIFDGVV